MDGINGRKRVRNIGMNIALSGGEFAVAHDLLNDGRSDVIAKGEGRCGGMTAGVRREIATAAAGKGEMEFLVEMITIHAKDLLAGRRITKKLEDGKDAIGNNNRGGLAHLGFQTAADDQALIPIDHILAEDEKLAGHHAGIDHEQDIADECITGIIR